MISSIVGVYAFLNDFLDLIRALSFFLSTCVHAVLVHLSYIFYFLPTDVSAV